jgi:metal-responsive CopG/Arc/MetJ family transcriptional regulator
MIQQDYFIRIIREFFEALARALEKKEMEGRSKAIQDMYQQYLGSYEYYQNATAEEAIDHITTAYPEEQRYQRMEMLAELYYAEAEWRAYPINTTLLERALQLFEMIDRNSDTFSLARADKIKDIQNRIRQ